MVRDGANLWLPHIALDVSRVTVYPVLSGPLSADENQTRSQADRRSPTATSPLTLRAMLGQQLFSRSSSIVYPSGV